MAAGSNNPSNNPKQNLSAEAQVGPPSVAARGNARVVSPVKKRDRGRMVRYPLLDDGVIESFVDDFSPSP